MKTFVLGLCAVIFSLGLSISDAEAARRLGGGGSVGMQRQVAPPPAKAPAAAPTPAPAPTAAAPAAQPKRSWLGPLAGLAAGIGLAALLSHFGLGEGVAQFLMFALLAIVVVMVVRFFLNRRNAATQTPMQYAGASASPANNNVSNFEPIGGGSAAAPAAAAAPAMLAGFDAEGFVRQAKLMFVRLQAANDTGNLDDLREFTSPEVFAEAQMAIKERGGVALRTEVVTLEADVLESAQEFGRYVVSVRFHGSLREDANAAEAFDEIWHVTKPLDGSRGWAVAGIQQTN